MMCLFELQSAFRGGMMAQSPGSRLTLLDAPPESASAAIGACGCASGICFGCHRGTIDVGRGRRTGSVGIDELKVRNVFALADAQLSGPP